MCSVLEFENSGYSMWDANFASSRILPAKFRPLDGRLVQQRGTYCAPYCIYDGYGAATYKKAGLDHPLWIYARKLRIASKGSLPI